MEPAISNVAKGENITLRSIIPQPPPPVYKRIATEIARHPGITEVSFIACELLDLTPLHGWARNADEQLVTLKFQSCNIQESAYPSLCHFLESNLVRAIAFQRCKCVDDDEYIVNISQAVRKNLSLRKFEYTERALTQELNLGVQDMISNNPNLVALSLTVKDMDLWELFRAVEKQSILQRLKISHSSLNLPSMEAIMMMCLGIDSLTSLDLCMCSIDKNAREYLTRSLSRRHCINALKVTNSRILGSYGDSWHSFSIQCGTMQVYQLTLKCPEFDWETFLQMVDSIAVNLLMKRLDLGYSCFGWDMIGQKVSDVLLRPNVGPTELVLNMTNSNNNTTTLTEVLQVNTRLAALTVENICENDLVTFAVGLANMRGLRKIVLKAAPRAFSKDFFQAMEASLEQNTTLQTLSIDGVHSDHPDAKPYLPRIKYFLGINRVGRNQLLTIPTPLGLWPHVIANSSSEPNGIYFVLTEMPDLI